MKYDNIRAFEKHLEGAKLLHFSPLYFVLGKEPYECQEAIKLLMRFLLPSQQMHEFGLSTLEGSQVEEKELESTLYSSSFFAKTCVIWIQQAEKLKKSVQEKIEKYLTRPSPSQYLLLSATSWQKNTSFYKTAEKEGIILEFAELKPWEKEKQLTEWVNKQATAARKLISYQACQVMVKRCNNDQFILANELEKLICYCGEKKEITLQDIETICAWQPVDSVWQLGESLFRRDVGAAIQMVHPLLMDGHGLFPLLRQIRAQFQTGYQICLLLAEGKQPHDIIQEFPYMKGQILDRQLRQAQQYGLDAFKRGLLAIDAAEIRAKNSAVDEIILIELLIMQLTHQHL